MARQQAEDDVEQGVAGAASEGRPCARAEQRPGFPLAICSATSCATARTCAGVVFQLRRFWSGLCESAPTQARRRNGVTSALRMAITMKSTSENDPLGVPLLAASIEARGERPQ
jgi:hypothetical protein